MSFPTAVATAFNSLLSSNADIIAYRATVTPEQFERDFGELIKDADTDSVLTTVSTMVTASCSDWPTLQSVMSMNIPGDSISRLVTDGVAAVMASDGDGAFMYAVVLLAAMKRARGL